MPSSAEKSFFPWPVLALCCKEKVLSAWLAAGSEEREVFLPGEWLALFGLTDLT